MKRVSKLKLMLISGLVLAIIIINLPVVYTNFYHEITGAPKAVKGSIDLYDSNDDYKIYLDGQWEFYWERFIISEHDNGNKLDFFIGVPDEWSYYKIDGENLPAGGFGSYRLNMKGIKRDGDISLYIPDFGGSYKVFVDGQLASESGTVSKDMDKIFTVPKADLYPVTLSSGTTHEIVIEVSTTRFSGLYMTPVLGDYHETINEISMWNNFRFILFGVVLFSFISMLVFYVFHVKQKLKYIWMPLTILFILMRIMLTSEFYSFWQSILFSDMSYEATNELMYFTTFVLKYLMIFLIQEQCDINFDKREKFGFLAYYVFLYLIYLYAPKSMYNYYLSVIVPMLSYALDFYLFIKVYLGRNKLRKFSITVFWCVILLMGGLAIDSYYINGKIYTNVSMAMLFLFTVSALILSYIFALRSQDVYDDFIISSSQLELANNQITRQKEYYDALSGQINEIREIKHDIRHFVRVMVSLAEDGEYDKLKNFLSEYSDKTEMEQLPVFCKNNIANSIIGYYYLQAKKYGIKFESRCSLDENIPMSDSDICVIFGNALENAMDACKKMDDSQERFMSVEAKKMKCQFLVKVENSYSGTLVMSDGRCVSSKSTKSHGLGIKNIEKVMESYGGFVKIQYDENKFTIMAAVAEK